MLGSNAGFFVSRAQNETLIVLIRNVSNIFHELCTKVHSAVCPVTPEFTLRDGVTLVNLDEGGENPISEHRMMNHMLAEARQENDSVSARVDLPDITAEMGK